MNTRYDVATVTLNPAIDRTLTIENFCAGKVNRVGEDVSSSGGKGVNIASALADFGLHVAVTGFLGLDNTEPFDALFARKKIIDRFVRIAGQARIGLKIVDPVRDQTTDINFPGISPAPADLDKLREQIASLDAAWFVLAGSLPPGVDAAIYRDFALSLKAQGCKVALDTSGEPLALAVEAKPNLIKPNIHELETMLDSTLEGAEAVIKAARQLVGRGIEMVVVSMGRDGACYVTKDEALIARPPDVAVRSTVGAGDAMVAGTLVGCLRGLSLGDCARMGTTFSIEALTRIESGLSSPRAVEALMAQVQIDESID
jgi:1-phosphofructokinase